MPSFRPARNDFRGAWRACSSTARTPPCFFTSRAPAPRYGSRCRKRGASPTSLSVKRSPSRSTRDAPCASARMRAVVSAAGDPLASRARLTLLLLLAPAAVWLIGLIVLPHVELAVLSLRERVAPRVYEWSLAQYRTFVDEPLYWRTFVRTATMSIVATA